MNRAVALTLVALDLRAAVRARRFHPRQGLWIEDLQTPPGQECSNGSMIFLAVVLWRAFFARRARLPGRAADPVEP